MFKLFNKLTPFQYSRKTARSKGEKNTRKIKFGWKLVYGVLNIISKNRTEFIGNKKQKLGLAQNSIVKKCLISNANIATPIVCNQD